MGPNTFSRMQLLHLSGACESRTLAVVMNIADTRDYPAELNTHLSVAHRLRSSPSRLCLQRADHKRIDAERDKMNTRNYI